MTRIAFSVLVLMVVAACVTVPPPYAGPAPVGACNAAEVAWAVGRAPTTDLIEQARRQSGSAVVRVLAPGQPADSDFRADRLTITTNERGAIIGLACG